MQTIDEYIEEHIAAEPPHLREVYRRTHLHCLYPRMCSGHVQGRLLVMLTRMINPSRIIELGSYTGYSSMCMAEGMPHGAQLHTIEADDEMEEMLRSNIALSPRASDIHVHIGDALTVLPSIGETWDMAFIDANKRHYTAYIEALLPRMRPGGYIIADNTLWGGKIIDDAHNHDAQSRGIMAFNDMVARHPRLETVIIPLRDGMTLMRVKDDSTTSTNG